MPTITLDGKQTDLVVGKTLLELADEVGVRVPSSCPGAGVCRECIVEVVSGAEALTPPTEPEAFLTGNYRLACQAEVASAESDLIVRVQRRQRQIVSAGSRPSGTPSAVAPLTCRQGHRVVRDGQVIDDYRGRLYGVAADIGTTTVALVLLNLETGQTLATASFENPQSFGGSDVVNRIRYDGEHPGELQRVLVAALNRELEQMPCEPPDLYELVVVGNSTMRDLLAGLDVQSLGQRPFKSLTQHELEEGERTTTALAKPTAELGLAMNAEGLAYFAPLISCHVGADAAACVLATRLHESADPVMMMDIGTNTEVVLGNRERLLCASCAAGPAFEGGRITYGMPGVEGAIESVVLRNSHVDFRTIGDVEPVGLCGSGLIDLIAELVRTGRINDRGRFVGDEKVLPIHPPTGVLFTESDIQELAQSKGATYAGVSLVLKHYPATLDQVAGLNLAGGFAHYINIANAQRIGLTPPLPADRIEKVGNAAVEGAKELLLHVDRRRALERLVQRIEHLELEADPDFFTLFVEGCLFGQP